MYIEKVLSNGIKVVAEDNPYIQSVTMGVWVGNGSRFEKDDECGISHFIEHMVFKGTENRTAKDIALEMDAIGGQLNAFTTREYTCFYGKTINEHVEKLADILSDMVFTPLLSEKDMNKERKVVLEEIAMYNDSPEDVVYDLYSETVWGDTPMGRPILGNPEVLEKITPEKMRDYMHSHYTNKNIVIAVAGRFKENLFDLLEKCFGSRKIADNEVLFPKAEFVPKNSFVNRDFEQVQLVFGFKGIDIYDEGIYSLSAFNTVFGNGMSSRLFQNIREKHGLVYSIGSCQSAYQGTGSFDIDAAVSPENAELVSQLVRNEIKDIQDNGITTTELERAKSQLRINFLLSNENISARMQNMGRTVLSKRKILTNEDVINKIMAVNSQSISEIIERVLDESTLCITAAGPITSLNGLI